MRFFLFDSYESPLSIGLIKTGGQKIWQFTFNNRFLYFSTTFFWLVDQLIDILADILDIKAMVFKTLPRKKVLFYTLVSKALAFYRGKKGILSRSNLC